MEIIRPHETDEFSRRFVKTTAVVDGIGRDREVESPRSVSAAVPYAAANESALPESFPQTAGHQRR